MKPCHDQMPLITVVFCAVVFQPPHMTQSVSVLMMTSFDRCGQKRLSILQYTEVDNISWPIN